jgi:CRISPR-associated protein Csd1
MILQELVNLYQRRTAGGESDLAPIGLQRIEIDFAIVLDDQGNLIDIEDLRSDGKKPIGRSCLVPQRIKRTVGVKAQLLWDNIGYVLGYDKRTDQKYQDRAIKEQIAFTAQVEAFSDLCNDPAITAIRKFLQLSPLAAVQMHPRFPELTESTGNISFRLLGQNHLVPESAAIHACVTQQTSDNVAIEHITCLVTGNRDVLKLTHPSIKGIAGAQPSGADIVSFNQPSFKFFSKHQGENAPVGAYAATAYTTALNDLLSRESRQRLQLGETSIVFWSEKQHEFEGLLYELFGDSSKDDAAVHTESVRKLYRAPETGTQPFETDPTRFFILALAPNSARIAIRFWATATVASLATNIRQYFTDIEIIGHGRDLTLIGLLLSTALEHKRDNLLPFLPASVLKSILDGGELPFSLANAVLRRIRAERRDQQAVSWQRAALLKAFLNRYDRNHGSKEAPIMVALDEGNTNKGYNLGRLFAVLERAQADALGDINASICDRFYSAASATPVTCFPLLMRLKNHHLAKITNKGRVVILEKQIGQIVDNISDFPSHLSLADQGRFAIGYYHQRQANFAKATASSPPEDTK